MGTPRYFHTANASRPYAAGGFSFTFVPCRHMAGRTEGILEVKDAEQANALANHGPPVREITAEKYEEYQKKKLSQPSLISAWRRPIENTLSESAPASAATPSSNSGLPLAVSAPPAEGIKLPVAAESLVMVAPVDTPKPATKRGRRK